jgi:2-phospho-L-lactate guanylyltransferase
MPAAILIPCNPFEEGKIALAEALSPGQRTALGRRFFEHVLEVATGCVPAGHCLVISRSAAVLGLASRGGAQGILERQHGLNQALVQGAAVARTQGADGLLVISADLPLLTAKDVGAMIEAGADAPIVIAPDAGETGTNALWLAPPAVIPFAFGKASFAAHREAALANGHSPLIIRSKGLACDVDTPEDLRQLRAEGWN